MLHYLITFIAILISILIVNFFNIKVLFLILSMVSLIHLLMIIVLYEKVKPLIQKIINQSSFFFLDRLSYTLFSVGINISCLYAYFKINADIKIGLPETIPVISASTLAIIVTKFINKTQWNSMIKLLVKGIVYTIIAFGALMAGVYYVITNYHE